MAIVKETSIDKIEILNNFIIQVREVIKLYEMDIEIATQYNRFVLCPGDDVSALDITIQKVANALWTPDIIADFLQKSTK